MADSKKPSIVALIPARARSLRVEHKNVRALAGHPMLAYTIAAARESGIFDAVMVSTDSTAYAEIARHYGAEVPFLRPDAMAGSVSPDFEWIADMLSRLTQTGRSYDCFSILRPTSPFRQPETIRRAWDRFLADDKLDSLRAVEKCAQHPGKMWVIREGRLLPLMPFGTAQQPWHSTPYQALPEIYVQNASLEIARSRVIAEGTITGTVIGSFVTESYEGFDINDENDWLMTEILLSRGLAKLPVVPERPMPVGPA